MLLASNLLIWWYNAGWKRCVQAIANRLDGTIDYFSFDLLLKTLFSPYRQISAGRVDGPLDVKLRAMVDKLFSRVIGAFIRLILLVVGGIAMALQVAFGLLIIIGWAVVPVLPIVGIALMLTGWAL